MRGDFWFSCRALLSALLVSVAGFGCAANGVLRENDWLSRSSARETRSRQWVAADGEREGLSPSGHERLEESALASGGSLNESTIGPRERRVRAVASRVDELESEVKGLRASVLGWRDESRSLRRQRDSLREESERMSSELVEVTADRAKLEEEIADLSEGFDELWEERDDLDKTVTELSEYNTELRKQVGVAHHELAEVRENLLRETAIVDSMRTRDYLGGSDSHRFVARVRELAREVKTLRFERMVAVKKLEALEATLPPGAQDPQRSQAMEEYRRLDLETGDRVYAGDVEGLWGEFKEEVVDRLRAIARGEPHWHAFDLIVLGATAIAFITIVWVVLAPFRWRDRKRRRRDLRALRTRVVELERLEGVTRQEQSVRRWTAEMLTDGGVFDDEDLLELSERTARGEATTGTIARELARCASDGEDAADQDLSAGSGAQSITHRDLSELFDFASGRQGEPESPETRIGGERVPLDRSAARPLFGQSVSADSRTVPTANQESSTTPHESSVTGIASSHAAEHGDRENSSSWMTGDTSGSTPELEPETSRSFEPDSQSGQVTEFDSIHVDTVDEILRGARESSSSDLAVDAESAVVSLDRTRMLPSLGYYERLIETAGARIEAVEEHGSTAVPAGSVDLDTDSSDSTLKGLSASTVFDQLHAETIDLVLEDGTSDPIDLTRPTSLEASDSVRESSESADDSSRPTEFDILRIEAVDLVLTEAAVPSTDTSDPASDTRGAALELSKAYEDVPSGFHGNEHTTLLPGVDDIEELVQQAVEARRVQKQQSEAVE